jgi:hypothetical protein
LTPGAGVLPARGRYWCWCRATRSALPTLRSWRASTAFRVQLRSDDAVVAAETEVLIGDSMGEMLAYYASVDLAFIGGSLLDFGSQNLIEAAACGTPILIGPSTRNFADAARGCACLWRGPADCRRQRSGCARRRLAW